MSEFSVPHDDLQDPQAITPRIAQEFEKLGLDIHKHEVHTVEDDPRTRTRHVTVKTTKYFLVGDVPWLTRDPKTPSSSNP